MFMNFRVALDLLGLDGDGALTSDRVRRSYMRKLRQYPPERDPDGFRRLREAYELVRQFAGDDEPADGELPDTPAAVVTADAKPPEAPVFDKPSVIPLFDELSQATEPAALLVPPPLFDELPRAAAIDSPPEAPELAKPLVPPPVFDELPPAAQVRRIQPAAPLSAMVPKLLALLAEGNVDAAIAAERAWRSSGDADDVRQSTSRVAARWTLVRELLDVAAQLPREVVVILARAISDGDLTTARPALEGFQRKQPSAASQANLVLAKHAPTLFPPIQFTLGAPSQNRPQAPPIPSYAPPRTSRKSGGRALGASLTAMAVLALIRLVTSTNSPHLDSYPQLNLPTQQQLEALSRPPVDLSALEALSDPPLPSLSPLHAPPYADITATAITSTAEIEVYGPLLSRSHKASPEQQAAVKALVEAIGSKDCARARPAIDRLEQAPFATDPHAALVVEYVEGFRLRTDIICPPPATPPPATGKLKHANRPAPVRR